jgi:hypothetical protein
MLYGTWKVGWVKFLTLLGIYLLLDFLISIPIGLLLSPFIGRIVGLIGSTVIIYRMRFYRDAVIMASALSALENAHPEIDIKNARRTMNEEIAKTKVSQN